ncbi:NifU family protein [Ancylobacter pratisalsi]|uniref:NifU family protein n=1 Tax=Ancylobacter pratisalsi TaxID=1745854 RepID=A0A6P1YII9_9HYPH|nr:NifU family protein [Ancylobacter pratisalsi]QIB33109.1 NifU family protein [Ancylobacter pratisalsi]
MSGLSFDIAASGTDDAPAPDARQVLEALDEVRRRIRAHAGDIEVVSISADREVTLAFTGTCVACPAQAMTVGAAVLPAVEKLAGVRTVSVQGMTVSPASVRRIRAMFG